MKSNFFHFERSNRFLVIVTVLLALCLTLITLPSYGGAAQMTVYTEAKEVDGFSNQLVSDVLSKAGYEVAINVVPWTRLVQLLDSQPNVLAFSMTRTPYREELYHWIGLIRPVSFKLWGLRERANELPQSLEEARDFRISALRGDVVANYLASIGFNNLIYLSQSSDTLTMLRRDRIDMMAYIESGIGRYLSARNAASDTLIPVLTLDDISTGHYLVMSKDSDPALVKSLKAAFAKVLNSRESN